ncbi:MAG: hypothetical protein AB7R69_03545 [Candidatus Babeliales bacterium]
MKKNIYAVLFFITVPAMSMEHNLELSELSQEWKTFFVLEIIQHNPQLIGQLSKKIHKTSNHLFEKNKPNSTEKSFSTEKAYREIAQRVNEHALLKDFSSIGLNIFGMGLALKKPQVSWFGLIMAGLCEVKRLYGKYRLRDTINMLETLETDKQQK